jgi:hypothetical protein
VHWRIRVQLRVTVSRVPAQVVFFLGDLVDKGERPPCTRPVPEITAPVRFLIAAMQMSFFALLWLNLIPPRESAWYISCLRSIFCAYASTHVPITRAWVATILLNLYRGSCDRLDAGGQRGVCNSNSCGARAAARQSTAMGCTYHHLYQMRTPKRCQWLLSHVLLS